LISYLGTDEECEIGFRREDWRIIQGRVVATLTAESTFSLLGIPLLLGNQTNDMVREADGRKATIVWIRVTRA